MRYLYFVALAVYLVSAAGAQAQSRYVCSSASGSTYQSSRPCPSSGDGLVYYGPATNQQRYETSTPKVGQAPSNLMYLSPRCASLNDAIRTASARGLKHDTVSQMSKEYSRECSQDESEANSRMSQERIDQTQLLKDAKATSSQEKERASMREQQCGESKRILHTKRARTDLTDGEKSELRRFEDNYRSRCG